VASPLRRADAARAGGASSGGGRQGQSGNRRDPVDQPEDGRAASIQSDEENARRLDTQPGCYVPEHRRVQEGDGDGAPSLGCIRANPGGRPLPPASILMGVPSPFPRGGDGIPKRAAGATGPTGASASLCSSVIEF